MFMAACDRRLINRRPNSFSSFFLFNGISSFFFATYILTQLVYLFIKHLYAFFFPYGFRSPRKFFSVVFGHPSYELQRWNRSEPRNRESVLGVISVIVLAQPLALLLLLSYKRLQESISIEDNVCQNNNVRSECSFFRIYNARCESTFYVKFIYFSHILNININKPTLTLSIKNYIIY